MADQNGDKTISYSEFILTAVDRSKFMQLEKLEAVFSELDTDKSNTLSFMELDSVLTGARHVDREQLKEAFEMVDESGAGEISFDQFKQLLKILLGQ